jgi:hypothetical protein
MSAGPVKVLSPANCIGNDPTEASRDVKLAADPGDSDNKKKYSERCGSGNRVPRDPANAARYLKLAEGQNDGDKICANSNTFFLVMDFDNTQLRWGGIQRLAPRCRNTSKSISDTRVGKMWIAIPSESV